MVGEGTMRDGVCVCNCMPEFLAGAILSGLVVAGVLYWRAKQRQQRHERPVAPDKEEELDE